jgi:hypothetical protein
VLHPDSIPYTVNVSTEVEADEWLEANPGDPDTPHMRAGRPDLTPEGLSSPATRLDQMTRAQANPHKVLTNLLRKEIESIDYTAPVSDDPQRAGEVVTIGLSIIRRLVNIILTGRDRDSIEAAKIAWAYMDGLPVQPIEFDISAVVAELAAARGLTAEDTARALDETRRVLNAAKNGSPIRT